MEQDTIKISTPPSINPQRGLSHNLNLQQLIYHLVPCVDLDYSVYAVLLE